MAFPLSLYIGLRYLRSKRHTHFISFMTGASMVGIALSVTVLVTVLSVMNGFDQIIRNRIFEMANHITIQDPQTAEFKVWPDIRRKLLKRPHIIGASPFLMSQGLLITEYQNQPLIVYGILPQLEHTVSPISRKLVSGKFSLKPDKNEVLIGERLAWQFGLNVGSQITLLIPTPGRITLRNLPPLKTFTVSGIFKIGKGHGLDLDSSVAYIHLNDMQTAYRLGKKITGLRVKTDHLYYAPQIANKLANTTLKKYIVSNWTHDYGSLMAAINLEKTMMFCTLSLLIAIAAFNLVSSLTMLVNEKKADIAILRTLGVRSSTVLKIFIIQGSMVGLIGTIIGLGGGILLAQSIGNLIEMIETLLGLELFGSNPLYLSNRLPSKIELFDLVKISVCSFSMSLLATLYPAWRATRTNPLETLRYE
jgi:lipoprotein-releasing system permease protein